MKKILSYWAIPALILFYIGAWAYSSHERSEYSRATIDPNQTEIRCIDGDTFAIGNTKYRLAFIDTPELGQANYNEASDYTCHWLNSNIFHINKTGKDKYGRVIAYLSAPSSDLHGELIALCLAEPFWTNTSTYYKDLYNNSCRKAH